MADDLRRLNEAGIAQFAEYLSQGAIGAPPHHLLNHPDTSEALALPVKMTLRTFKNRYEFGRELGMRLASLDQARMSNDRGLWTWLALYFFDQLCPPSAGGKRKLDKHYRYILSGHFRHYYRHLVRSPWQLCRDHGPNSRFLLLAANDDGEEPLRRHGDVLEQLGGTQSIIRSRPIIAEASRLYSDPISGRPRKGAAGKGGGSVRRFARVLRQLDLTFDPDFMPAGGLSAVLPVEFNAWKKTMAKPSLEQGTKPTVHP
ncbi:MULTISPECIES: hypothetical protein [Bradyrhizobium]|uniref:Uncharacterized protein n=1 Tax=Bradyrhizobium elkanii TaxID=29448 RepID=A0A4U6RD98_BRAEL|nr:MULTISPECIES: hypothetical protein [Bradyrhizobium]MTV17909.1 hypothetical protein [Bradyrhizobium sp. BR2003]TKV71781.1 hypothetical protein FDV58_38650 [Bradyrhizobium elkanii]